MKWSQGKGSSGLPSRVFGLLCGVGLAVAGCAGFTDDALQQDVSQLRRDVNALMLAANRGRGDAQALSQTERRYTEQLAESARQSAALSSRLDGLNAEITRLSARLDSLSQRVEGLSRQGQRLGAAPNVPAPSPPIAPPPPRQPTPSVATPGEGARASAAPPAGAGPGSSVPGPSPSTAVPPPRQLAPSVATPGEGARASAAPPAGAGPGSSGAQESYQAAYLDFSRGRYPLAISEFRDFIRRFPDSPLADSAQYTIGESYFSLARASSASGQSEKSRQELEQSVQEFRKVLVNYPRGSKVPPALYKEALALTELKQTALAQSRLQYLVDHFPQSEEAPLAKERLAALKQ